MNKNTIAVLIPCYNEAQTIAQVITQFKKQIPGADIYVYDNNSTDDTYRIAEESGALLSRESKQGKGNVIRSMFRQINADCYIMVDGDDTYPAERAVEMIQLIFGENVDMVIGDRLSSTYFTENKRLFHNFGNKLVRKLINSLFKADIRDIMTGYRAFSYDFVKTFPVTSSGFEIETEMTIHALDNKLNIKEIVVDYRDRPIGSESKLHTLKDGFRVLKTIFLMVREYKPFLFFSFLSLVFFMISTFLFIPVYKEYLHTGLVARFPTLIVSGFILIIAVISFFTGLVLDVVVQKYRQHFLIQLNATKRKRDFQ